MKKKLTRTQIKKKSRDRKIIRLYLGSENMSGSETSRREWVAFQADTTRPTVVRVLKAYGII